MDRSLLETGLADLPLGTIEYYDLVGSTNDVTRDLLERGAPDLSVVVANQQSAGRGRLGRKWITQPGAGLAFSILLRNLDKNLRDDRLIALVAGLGAIAVCGAIQAQYSLQAYIKWPNDVLLAGRKVAGVLAEAIWVGDKLEAVILGIGVNVRNRAVPAQHEISFPATSIEACMTTGNLQFNRESGRLDRVDLLHAILSGLLVWRDRISHPDFIATWEQRLAFQGDQVVVTLREGKSGQVTGVLLGIGDDGHLRLRDDQGTIQAIYSGDLTSRPVTPEV